jgi:hypothetical protein
LWCGSHQAALFTSPSSFEAKSTLQVPRFGHTATYMADGNVLVVGGIGAGSGTPRVLGDAEEYNPRPGPPQYDPASGNPDPDDPITPDLVGKATRAPGAVLSPDTQCGVL